MRSQTIIVRDEVLRKRVIQLLSALNLDGPWEITVKPYRKRRSLSQNSLLWLWLNEVADHVSQHTGMDVDDIHAFFKQKFLPAKIIEISGETVECRTTTKLTTLEMADYMNKIYAFVTSELGVLLPLPQDFQKH